MRGLLGTFGPMETEISSLQFIFCKHSTTEAVASFISSLGGILGLASCTEEGMGRGIFHPVLFERGAGPTELLQISIFSALSSTTVIWFTFISHSTLAIWVHERWRLHPPQFFLRTLRTVVGVREPHHVRDRTCRADACLHLHGTRTLSR